MSHGMVVIHKDGKDKKILFQRKVLGEAADAGTYPWFGLDLPVGGSRFGVKNETTGAVLDVSFMEKPQGVNVQDFFTLGVRGSESYRDMNFVPRYCWVRQHEVNQPFYWEVEDELTEEEREKVK